MTEQLLFCWVLLPGFVQNIRLETCGIMILHLFHRLRKPCGLPNNVFFIHESDK